MNKIFTTNNSLIEKFGLNFPLKHFSKLDLYQSTQLLKAKEDGFYINITSIENGVLGSEYSEEKWIKRLLKKIEVIPRCIYYVFGFGTGSFIHALLQHIPNSSQLICFEPNSEILCKVFEHIDLSHVLENERFVLFVNKDLENNKQVVKEFAINQMHIFERSKFVDVLNVPSMERDIVNLWRKTIGEGILEGLKFTSMSINTIDACISHYYKNAFVTLECHDWEYMISQLKGKSIVLVGIGPSMMPQIEYIKQCQDSCYVACVDNAFKELLHHGIEPDFVFHLDFQKETIDFFDNIEIPPKTVLVFLPSIHRVILDVWKGLKLSYPADQIRHFFGEYVNDDIFPFVGTNVGMMAFQFAIYTKCAKIFLVGFDMCSPLGSYNHPNTAYMREMYKHSSRFCSPEKLDYLLVYLDHELIEIKGFDGCPVPTKSSMDQGRVLLGEIYRRYGRNSECFSTSRYGSGIDGVKVIDFDEIIEKHLQEHNKVELRPNQHCLKIDEFVKSCERKKKEVKTYFEMLDDTFHCASDLLSARDQGRDEKQLEFFQVKFAEAIDILKQSKCLWVQDCMCDIDKRLMSLAEIEKNRRKDLVSDEDKLFQSTIFFIEQYEIFKTYKSFFKNYFQELIDTAKSKGR